MSYDKTIDVGDLVSNDKFFDFDDTHASSNVVPNLSLVRMTYHIYHK